MSWLRVLVLLVQFTLELARFLRERGLVEEAETRSAEHTMELTVERLRQARSHPDDRPAVGRSPDRVPDDDLTAGDRQFQRPPEGK